MTLRLIWRRFARAPSGHRRFAESVRANTLPTARRGLEGWLVTCALVIGLGASPGAIGQGTTAPAALRVVVISDLNESYGSVRYSTAVSHAVKRITEVRPDLVISTGDMVAGQRLAPPMKRAELEAMWTAFHEAVSDPLGRAGVPFAVTPGNHDASTGTRFAIDRTVYREQWLPRRPALDFVDASGYPFNYAFAVGPVLFVSLDATYVGHLAAREKRWLANLLEQHGPRFRYRVVFSHIPLWPFSVGRETEYLGDDELERILQQHRVDLHLSGHHHAYYPGEKDGVRYIGQACLGAAPRPLLGTGQPSEHAITVIEFPSQGRISVEGYRGPDFTQRIDRRTLPERVTSKRATLLRDDLAGAHGSAGPK
jgi:3',5'-cyclic AMP phosphodiesterase CpdA